MSDDNKPPPDPRYIEWDKKSRKELRDRLYEAVDRRCEATQDLIPKVIASQLRCLSLSNALKGEMAIYRVSRENVLNCTHSSIDEQIRAWKGLRWWRFNENVGSYPKWFKKAKCWQDQNQHKPLGRFWCLILDELKAITLKIATNAFSKEHIKKQQALHRVLYSKCVEAILKGAVRFERTRETPLLPVRVLTQSKELQQKLQAIDNGFTLSLWKQQAEQAHKRQKQQQRNNKSQRANVATLLNEKCAKHATSVYLQSIESLKEIMPSLNVQDMAIESDTVHRYEYNPPSMPPPIDDEYTMNKYGPSRVGVDSVLRAESHRYSPTLSSNSISDISSLSDAASIGSNYGYRQRRHSLHSLPRKPPIPTPSAISDSFSKSEVNRLSVENERLRAELNEMRLRMNMNTNSTSDTLQTLVHQMAVQNYMMAQRQWRESQTMNAHHIPSPMTVPTTIPPSVMLNDGRGGHGVYSPPNGTMFYFPSSNNTESKQEPQATIDIDNIINNSNIDMEISDHNNPSSPGIPSNVFYPRMSPSPFHPDSDPYRDHIRSPRLFRERSFDNTSFFEHPPTQIHTF